MLLMVVLCLYNSLIIDGVVQENSYSAVDLSGHNYLVFTTVF